jgi:exopolysaccharide biosynthesis polyprenyl glycosylphosphotransferase
MKKNPTGRYIFYVLSVFLATILFFFLGESGSGNKDNDITLGTIVIKRVPFSFFWLFVLMGAVFALVLASLLYRRHVYSLIRKNKPIRIEPEPSILSWENVYALRLVITDSLSILVSLVLVQLLKNDSNEILGFIGSYEYSFNYLQLSLFILVGWIVALQMVDSRGKDVIGVGIIEYKKVFIGSLAWFALLFLLFYIIRIYPARIYILLLLPVALVCMFVTRRMWRIFLDFKRTFQHLYLEKIAVLGTAKDLEAIYLDVKNSRFAAYDFDLALVIGKRMPKLPERIKCVPSNSPVSQMRDAGIATIVVSSFYIKGDKITNIKDISWQLDPRKEKLIMYSGLSGLLGNRTTMHSIPSVPFVSFTSPNLSPISLFSKRALDILGAIFAIILSIPIYLGVWIAMRFVDRGHFFFKQTRIGLDSKPYTIYKIRSMKVNADAELKKLLKEQGSSDKPLFKVENDPRITKLGHFLRKYSIDELPQFFNVLIGNMSLVGPRPQVKGEVELYDDTAHRRLLTKPGITGYWQVNGRSNTSWEEALYYDLYYIDNYSLLLDLQILLKTLIAVFRAEGAQ